jgi:biopolymer transport protein ExbB
MKNCVSITISALFAAIILSASAIAAGQTPAPAPDASAPPSAAPANAAPAAVAPASATDATPAPAAADATAAPATAAPVETKETVDNPYGLEAVWHGDFISKGTLIILSIMSMGSWYILITKMIDQFKLNSQSDEAKKNFWKSSTVQSGIGRLKEGSPFRYIAESGSKATDHQEGNLLDNIDLNEWVTMSIQRAVEKIQSRLQDGLAFLATVGSTAPFIGLFGTVWGIYNALTAIGIAGQASIDKVAGPVGEALIMTAFGLFVAVPAVLGYNFLVRRNKSAMEEVRTFSSDLHLVLLSGAMSTAGHSTKKAG